MAKQEKNEKYFTEQVKKEEVRLLDYLDKVCKEQELKYYLIGGTLLGAIRHNGFIPWDDDIDVAMPRKDYNKLLKYLRKNIDDEFIIDYYKTNKTYCLPFAKIRIKNTEYVEAANDNFEQEHSGIWIDIFPLDNGIKENALIHRLQQNLYRKVKGAVYVKNAKSTTNKRGILKTIVAKIIKILPNNFYHHSMNFFMTMTNWYPNSKYYINYGSQYGIKKQTHEKSKFDPSGLAKFENNNYSVPCDYDYVLTRIYGKNYMELPPKEKRINHSPVKIKLSTGEEYNCEKI